MNTKVKAHKTQIRATYLNRRSKLSKATVKAASQAIIQKILESPHYQEANKVFFYYPHNNECDLRQLADHALAANKQVAFPKSFGQRKMDFYQVESLEDFRQGRYAIMEPISTKVIYPDTATMILVPGVAFDAKGYRIGYGGGYYDAYFQRFSDEKHKKIGVYYQWQQTPTLPVESHDIPLDSIVSD